MAEQKTGILPGGGGETQGAGETKETKVAANDDKGAHATATTTYPDEDQMLPSTREILRLMEMSGKSFSIRSPSGYVTHVGPAFQHSHSSGGSSSRGDGFVARVDGQVDGIMEMHNNNKKKNKTKDSKKGKK